MIGQILIVDDELLVCEVLREHLEAEGFLVEFTTQPEKGLELLRKEPFDAVITDLRMRGMDGLELLQRAKATRPDCEVIMMTGHATAERALQRVGLYSTEFESVAEQVRQTSFPYRILKRQGCQLGSPAAERPALEVWCG